MSALKTRDDAIKVRAASDDATAQDDASHSKTLYIIAALVALIGLADAIYLTAQHAAGMDVKCFAVTGCADVLGSDYALMFGLPVSALGAFAYFVAFSLATLAAFKYKYADQLFVSLVAVMFLMTLWLLYVQAFKLHKFCSYCLLSAVVTLTLTVLVSLMNRAARR